jgi:hypothetical protein
MVGTWGQRRIVPRASSRHSLAAGPAHSPGRQGLGGRPLREFHLHPAELGLHFSSGPALGEFPLGLGRGFRDRPDADFSPILDPSQPRASPELGRAGRNLRPGPQPGIQARRLALYRGAPSGRFYQRRQRRLAVAFGSSSPAIERRFIGSSSAISPRSAPRACSRFGTKRLPASLFGRITFPSRGPGAWPGDSTCFRKLITSYGMRPGFSGSPRPGPFFFWPKVCFRKSGDRNSGGIGFCVSFSSDPPASFWLSPSPTEKRTGIFFRLTFSSLWPAWSCS